MKMINRIAGLSLAAALMFPATQAFAVEEHYLDDGAVVGGYDVVAYHTDGKPMKGMGDYSAMYQGAKWHFASKKNQELFEADPAKYAPAYGGWCAAGASKGKKVPTKPELWAIIDGQLYLNSSDKAHNGLFLKNTDAVIRKGEGNWKRIFATARGDL